VPLAAVRPHLQRREKPPAIVDEIITITYRSLTESRTTPTAAFPKRRDRNRQNPAQNRKHS
jgi:hypothetical protein